MTPWLVVQDQADGAANAAADTGSFSRLTHAAEFYASQAATQAAGLFSSKKTGDEKSQDWDVADMNEPCLHESLWEIVSIFC